MLTDLTAKPAAVRDLVSILRLVADPTRLRLLGLLQPGERNVSSLCETLGLAQPTVSHHLGLMREAGMLATRRDGKQVFYSINPETIDVDQHGRHIAIDAGPLVLRFENGLDQAAVSELEAKPFERMAVAG